MKFSDLPVIFISYKEPNADKNFEVLVKQDLPLLGRVKDVKGFDSAHKAALNEALMLDQSVSHFLTVDGDTRVMPWVWQDAHTENLPNFNMGPPNNEVFDRTTYSWKSINTHNGLAYGNGSLKLWSRQFVEQMATHENYTGEGTGNVDFCWDTNYIPMEAITSYTYIDGSPEQAWRAGFREGAKLLLDQGKVPGHFELGASDHNMINARRFVQWASVGRHTEFGHWSMLGALQGFLFIHAQKNPIERIADYDFLTHHWNETAKGAKEENVLVEIDDIRQKVAKMLGLPIPAFGPTQSQTVVNMIYHRRLPIGKREDWQFWSCDPTIYGGRS